MKILVTGGASFIGSAVVRHIIENTHDSVISVDKLTYAGNLSSLVNINTSDRYRFYRTDIYNSGAPLAIFDVIDASKIERELGWVPEETFESGIEKTVRWYLNNHHWWQAVMDGSYSMQRLGEAVSDQGKKRHCVGGRVGNTSTPADFGCE